MCKFTTLILTLLLTCLSAYGEIKQYHRYNRLLQKCAKWPSDRVITLADSLYLAEQGRENEALVLYMLVAQRPTDGISDDELSNHVKADMRAGNIHYGKGNYSNALRYYVSGLKLSESSDKHPYLADLYNNMGNVYNVFQDYEKGQGLYLSGLKEAQRTGDKELAYKLLQNLVGVSINLNDVKSARRYYEQARSSKHKVSDESIFMDNYTLALILKHEGRLRESIEPFKNLTDYSKSKGLNARYTCSAYGELGRIYNSMERTDSAIFYLSRCKEVAQANGILYQYAETTKRLEKTEREIIKLNERQARDAMLISRQRMVLWGVVGAVILAVLLLYYFYRQKKKLADNYRNLYDIHQRMLSDHRDYTDRYMAVSRENEALHERILQLSGQTDSGGGEGVTELPADMPPLAESDTDADCADSKYKRSGLSSSQRDRLARAVTEVMENVRPFCSTDFSLNNLAAEVDSNNKYVSQVINDVFKKNFSTFVNEYRINLACERLADTAGYGHYSINGIGDSVGFKSYGTFSAVFKRMTGMTPSVYQKLTRKKQAKLSKQEIKPRKHHDS